MKSMFAAVLAIDLVLSACAPTPYPVYVAPAPIPLAMSRERLEECALIRSEIARQLRVADYSGVMATGLVEASMRVNVSNVLYSLYTRAQIEGCPA